MVPYASSLVLAPMVRAGELPTRLLALKFGADLVWSPEIIDKKIIQCDRVVNKELNTIDFLLPGPTKFPGISNLAFRTMPSKEAGKLIFQMGTANADLAVQAGLKVIHDVDGIDVNSGCPKHFSIHSGMGAALLKTPDLLCDILTSLVEKVGKPNNKPISVKIRLLPEKEDTLTLVRRLVKTGITNLTVHCRTQPMRNREAPIRDYVPELYQICQDAGVSFIVNGQIKNKKEYLELKQKWNLPEMGGMMAEFAEQNPTVFSNEPLEWPQCVKEYLQICQELDNYVGNTKYMLSRLVPGKSSFYQYFVQCKTSQDIYDLNERLGADGEEIGDVAAYVREKRDQEKSNKKNADKQRSIEIQMEKQRIKGCCIPREKRENQEEEEPSKRAKVETEVESKVENAQ